MPTPTDKSGIQRFLGVVSYVSKFISNLSRDGETLTSAILPKNIAWHWNTEQAVAFEKFKNALITAPVLKYFDITK